MLPLLALGIVAVTKIAEPVLPKRSAAAVVQIFSVLNGSPETTNKPGTSGFVHHGDGTARFTMWTHFGPHGDEKTTWISAIDLSAELIFPEEVHTPDLSQGNSSREVTSPTLVISHLGRTATVEKHVEFAEPLSLDRVRADFDDFWHTAETYAQAHAGTFAPNAEPPSVAPTLSDRLVLDKADPVSLERATGAWGWTWRKDPARSGAGWVFPIDLDGRLVWVSENLNGSFPLRTSFRLSSQVASSGGSPAASTEGKSENLDGKVVVSDVDGRTAYARCEIDLSRGMSLADTRKRFEAYAAALTRLDRRPKP